MLNADVIRMNVESAMLAQRRTLRQLCQQIETVEAMGDGERGLLNALRAAQVHARDRMEFLRELTQGA